MTNPSPGQFWTQNHTDRTVQVLTVGKPEGNRKAWLTYQDVYSMIGLQKTITLDDFILRYRPQLTYSMELAK